MVKFGQNFEAEVWSQFESEDFKACWSFYFELWVLNESKHSMPWVCCTFANVIYCNLGARFAVLMTMWTVSFSLKKITDFQDFPNQLVISPACWDSTAYQDIQAWAPQDSQKPSWPRWEPWSDYDDNQIRLNCYCWVKSSMVEGRFSKWF